MSMGPGPGIGGGLTLGETQDCYCAFAHPWFPPDPCCSDDGSGDGSGNGGACSSDGSGTGVLRDGGGPGSGDGTIFACRLDITYGGGRGSLTPIRGSFRNGAFLLSPSNGGNVPCTSLTGTPPVGVPASSSGHSINAGIFRSSTPVEGLTLTCTESGVSFITNCNPGTGLYTFYFNDGNAKHFTTPGGVGAVCGSNSQTFQSGAASGTGTVIIMV